MCVHTHAHSPWDCAGTTGAVSTQRTLSTPCVFTILDYVILPTVHRNKLTPPPAGGPPGREVASGDWACSADTVASLFQAELAALRRRFRLGHAGGASETLLELRQPCLPGSHPQGGGGNSPTRLRALTGAGSSGRRAQVVSPTCTPPVQPTSKPTVNE